MDFGKVIKDLRSDNNLTQEELAQTLHVSRQAVSNWENSKNYPDLGVLIQISKIYSITLDELIGGNEMTSIKAKLINDGSETKRTKFNMIIVVVGLGLFLFGTLLIFIKANSPVYIDESGILHENFYLLPIGFLFIFSGIITFTTVGLTQLFRLIKKLFKDK